MFARAYMGRKRCSSNALSVPTTENYLLPMLFLSRPPKTIFFQCSFCPDHRKLSSSNALSVLTTENDVLPTLFCPDHRPWVPHISLVFREMWDSTALDGSPLKDGANFAGYKSLIVQQRVTPEFPVHSSASSSTDPSAAVLSTQRTGRSSTSAPSNP
jgi:hypothetical protein